MYQPWQSILLVIAQHANSWTYAYLREQVGDYDGSVLDSDPGSLYQVLVMAAMAYESGPDAYAHELSACAELDSPQPQPVLPIQYYQAAALASIPMYVSITNPSPASPTRQGISGDPYGPGSGDPYDQWNQQQQTGGGRDADKNNGGGFWDGVTFNTVADFLEEAGRIITGARSGGASPGTSGPMPAQEPPKKNGNLVFIIGGVVLVGLIIALVIKSRS